MKALKTGVFFIIFLCAVAQTNAQSDSAIISSRAILYADSMLQAFRYANWNQYVEMSYPGVIKYYGGKKGYGEYIQRARSMTPSNIEENREKTELIQLVNDGIIEWQCVIRKTRETTIDNKKAFVISYMVGQSKDNGQNWKYFDVAFNSVENIIYIMPDIFDMLAIPQRQVLFEKEYMASYQ